MTGRKWQPMMFRAVLLACLVAASTAADALEVGNIAPNFSLWEFDTTDRVHLSETGSMQLGGTLAVVGIDRSNANWTAEVSRRIIDGAVTGAGFDAVTAEPGTTITSHIGQGVFLREVTTTAGGVDLELFIALGGDTNGDGTVWLQDWLNFRPNFNPTGSELDWTDGDFDGDGKVWLQDWLIFRPNFSPNSYVVSEGTAVPEPGTAAMLLAALIGLPLTVWHRSAGGSPALHNRRAACGHDSIS